MGSRALSACLLAIALTGLLPQRTSADFQVETGAAKVIFPPGSGQRVDIALANFGKPKYGGTLM